jgi:hypothetical protein
LSHTLRNERDRKEKLGSDVGDIKKNNYWIKLYSFQIEIYTRDETTTGQVQLGHEWPVFMILHMWARQCTLVTENVKYIVNPI